jgi:cysteine-rich repeat protein
MKQGRAATLVIYGLLWTAALPSSALALVAASADDICAPAENPCVIDVSYDVTGYLDFGSRSVLITGNGRLHGQPEVGLSAGEITVDVGDGVVAIDAPSSNVGLSARRACSGDGTTLCLASSQCSGLGLGTCTAGSPGTIDLNGGVSTTGAQPGEVYLSAAGDITTSRRISANATQIGEYAGTMQFESFQGSVRVEGPLAAASATGSTYNYSPEGGGEITLEAAVDVILSGEARAWGAAYGGRVTLTAGRDVLLHGDIVSNAGSYSYAWGGYVTLESGRDLKVYEAAGGEPTQEINTSGGGRFNFYGYGSGGYWSSGYGGYQYLRSGNDLWLGTTANLFARGGPGAKGGQIDLDAEGTALIEGNVFAHGIPPFSGGDTGAAGGDIRVTAGEGITLTETGVLSIASPMGFGGIGLYSDGPMDLAGLIDARGTATAVEYWYGSTGYMNIIGNSDVTIRGNLRGDSQGGNETWNIEVCRLHLTPEARIRLAFGGQYVQGATGLEIRVGESMRADAGSSIATHPDYGTQTFLYYRDPKKPPVLSGTISPAPQMIASPSLLGCPVCGNGEIDFGESCDDGNLVSGDGCRSDCQDEGCLAESPGFPGTVLCFDGVACTADECDPVAHECRNPVSCDDGVACTVDTCMAGECQHAAVDALCDDQNECTDDLCNETTGCAFAGLTGITCEDGDFCTPPGTCQSGDCLGTTSVRTTRNSLKTRVSDGTDDDQLKSRGEIPLESLTADPTVSGATVVLSDADDEVVYTAELPASGWLLRGESSWSYRADGASASVKANLTRGTVRVSVKLSNADVAGSLAQSQLSMSVLFGTDVATDMCLTARQIPCTSKATSTKCKD